MLSGRMSLRWRVISAQFENSMVGICRRVGETILGPQSVENSKFYTPSEKQGARRCYCRRDALLPFELGCERDVWRGWRGWRVSFRDTSALDASKGTLGFWRLIEPKRQRSRAPNGSSRSVCVFIHRVSHFELTTTSVGAKYK